MPRDRRVGLERQADLLETRARRRCGPVGPLRSAGKKPSTSSSPTIVALDVDRDRAADQLAAAAEDRDRLRLRPSVGQQGFLGGAARVPQGDRLPGVELHALLGELLGHVMGQGQVHVVAADQQVVAHGQSLAGPVRRPRSATPTSVRSVVPPPTSQTSSLSPGVRSLAPAVAPCGQPGVDGRLRLFQQHQVGRQPGRQRRLAGQFAGAGVERGRHGQHDLLLGERGVGKLRLPGRDQVLQVALRGGAPARSWRPRPARSTAGSAGGGRRGCGPTTTWRPRRSARAPRPPAAGPTRPPRSPLPSAHGRSSAPPAASCSWPGRRTTAGRATFDRVRATNCGIASSSTSACSSPAARRPARCWSSPGRSLRHKLAAIGAPRLA